jgi:hypothetical protein
MKFSKTLYGHTYDQILEESEGRKWVNLWMGNGGFKNLQILTKTDKFIILYDKSKTYKVVKSQ